MARLLNQSKVVRVLELDCRPSDAEAKTDKLDTSLNTMMRCSTARRRTRSRCSATNTSTEASRSTAPHRIEHDAMEQLHAQIEAQ